GRRGPLAGPRRRRRAQLAGDPPRCRSRHDAGGIRARRSCERLHRGRAGGVNEPSWSKVRRLHLVGPAADWGMGGRAASKKTREAAARTEGLKATESVCPYCAVGCGQVVYTRGGELVSIEGNPRSPINQGTLCPKGSASRQLVQQPGRLTKVLYRAPHATEWRELGLEQAMDMITERVIAARERGWQDTDDEGDRVDRTLG